GRHARERVKKAEANEVPAMVLRRLAELHGAFTLSYGLADDLTNARRHVAYAQELGGMEGVLLPAAESLIEEARKLMAGKDGRRGLRLIELAYDLTPTSEVVRKQYSAALTQYALECATKEKLDEAEEYVRRAERMDSRPE